LILDLLLLFFFIRFSVALDIIILINNVTVFIDRVANKFLRVTLCDLANTVTVVVLDESILDHT